VGGINNHAPVCCQFHWVDESGWDDEKGLLAFLAGDREDWMGK
jgi:hypothetical protein